MAVDPPPAYRSSMPPLGAARAAIFDLDGTLVDSLPDIAGHLNAALADAGFPTYSHAEIRRWVGSGAAQLVARAIGEQHAADVLTRFRAHYRAAPFGRTAVFPGLAEVLDGLGQHLAILSNKPHDLVVAIAEGLLVRWPFREIVGERAGTPRKPDPTALLAIARALDVEPATCVMIGDSEIDIATARAAGMPSVAVTWGLCDVDALTAAAPDHLISTPEALAELFA
jgi:phosphoglycolate phosphatase